MKNNTIIELYHFQFNYLIRLINNIPEDRIYEKQLKGVNTAGWVLGHLCVEAEDPLNYLAIDYPQLNEQWKIWFGNSIGKIESLEGLPTKKGLLTVLELRYQLLITTYSSLTLEQKVSPNPSQLLKGSFSSFDTWFAHHITTHISIHCGNLVVWKKIIGLDVEGY